MKGNHSASPRPRGEKKTPGKAASGGGLLKIGWAFLGLMLLLAGAAVLRLARSGDPNAAPLPTVDPGPAGSAFTGHSTATLTTGEGQGGRAVKIKGVDVNYTPPEELTFGRLTTVDLSALGQSVADNVRAMGWGEIVWSETDNGALLLRAAAPKVLTGDDFERQSAYLASDKPEAAARTFLDHSRLVSLLQPYGLHLDLAAENNGGEITFRGTGDAPQSSCSVQLTFLYTARTDTEELPECAEGELKWIPIDEVLSLPLWEGDRVFIPLLQSRQDCFSLKLEYAPGGAFIRAVLDGEELK